MKTTDFLTELSNTKLGLYKTAAGADATAADKAGNFKRGNKRMSGITNATKKEFANDAAKAAADAAAKAKKVDEGVNISPDQIQQMFQGAQKIGTAGGTNRSMIGKAKDMFSKPNPVAAPGLKQSTSVDPSVSAAQKPTTRVGKAAQSTRQQKQAQAAKAAQAGMTPAPVAPVATPAPVTPPAEPASYKDTFPKAAAAAERDKAAAASIKPAVWKSNRKPNDPAKTSPTELSESQIYRLIGAIVNKHKKQVDEGVMDWAKTKGQNLTNKITADKLLQAWNKAGKPTDSDQIAALMVKAGVPQETLNNLYTNFKLPAPQAVPAQPAQPKQGLLGRMAGGVGSAVGGVKGTIAGVKDAYGGNKMTGFDASRAKQGMQHVGHTGEVNPYTRATAPNNTATAPSNTTTNQGGPGTGNTIWHGPTTTQTAATSAQAAAPTATNTTTSQPAAATGNAGAQATPKPGRVGAPAGKQAVDQAVAAVKSVRPDRMPQVVNYGKQQFDTLAQTTAKKPVATATQTTPKPNNTIAMPKQGEKIKWGGQEFRPGDPMYDQMKAASGTNESLGLNYPETYEQTNDKFKSKGQRRVAALTNEQNYDSGDYSNARMGREYGKSNYHVDTGASHFEKERVKNEPGGELGRPKSLAGASKSLPADPFSRTTGQIPKGKTGQVHKVDMDEEKQRLDPHCWDNKKIGNPKTKMKGGTRVNNCVPKESAILKGLNQIDEGWKSALGSAALAGAMAMGGGHAQAADLSQFGTPYLQQVASGQHPRPMVNVDDAKAELQARANGKQQTTAPAKIDSPSDPNGFSKEYLQRAADPQRVGRYLISVEKAQELLQGQQ